MQYTTQYNTIQYDFSKEEIAIVRYSDNACKYVRVEDTDQLGEAIDQFTNFGNTGYELQYMDGELSGKATDDPFMCYLVAEEQNAPLWLISTLYNFYGDIVDVETILKYDYCIKAWGTDETDAFKEYVNEIGILSDYPQEIKDYFDYEQYKFDRECEGNFQILKTDLSRYNGRVTEYLYLVVEF